LAFVIAFGATVALTPLMRRVALAFGIVDRPAARKFHAGEIPYMGGVAIAGGALIGLALQPRGAPRIGFLALVAVVLAVVGLLDDDRTLSVAPRLVTQLGAAICAVGVGVRARPTGFPVYDVAITVVLVVAVTNALNLLDNMDGLAGGIGFAISGGAFALATFGNQDIVAALTAGVCGACLGFLAFNWRPAAIFMGDAGALFLGFVLSVAVLDVKPAVAEPGSFAVQLMLLAVPLLDTCTVAFARMRHGVRVSQAGKDHLSHRLVTLGLPPAVAVAVLVAVQCVVSGLAVFAGRGVVGLPWAFGTAALLCGALLAVCSRARVYRLPVVGLPRLVRLAIGAAVTVTVTVAGVVALAALSARRHVDDARTHVERAISALRAGETGEARAAFTRAGEAFRAAERAVDSPFTAVARAVPLVAPNVRAADDMLHTGERLAIAGARLAAGVDPERLHVDQGTVPIAEVERVAPDLAEAARLLRDSRVQLGEIERTYLLPVVTDAIDELDGKLLDAQVDAERAANAAEVVPEVFGSRGTRRYFLAVQNSAELRATGGFIGNWGILVAAGGRVTLEEFDRVATLNERGDPNRGAPADDEFLRRYGRFDVARTWQNVNMSPDFPTVGRVIERLLPQSGGPDVDGVIAVDSIGLRALLELTGPVTVPQWPEPIRADNVVDVTLRDAYAVFTDRSQREDFLGEVARAVWRATTSSDLGSPQHIGRTLGAASDEGHLLLWMQREDEQRVAEQIGAAHRVAPPAGDSLLVVSQNAAGNKTDYYLDRTVSYEVALTPSADGTAAAVDGKVETTLRNGAPASGLPEVVIGPYDERFEPGENRAYVSVYTPHRFARATLDGRPRALESAKELDRRVYSAFVGVPARSARTLGIVLTGRAQLVDGWYRVDVLKQPTLHPDTLEITVRVPPGWRITDAIGVEVAADGRTATLAAAQASARTIGVRIGRARPASILDRLQGRG
jgi:UDP-GlcNAc:undecaprenyl-phosphate GlcNAc-1-phosphate transferase